MKIHFIGIGGIGVSALAQYYLAKGHKVSGSDLVFSEITSALRKLGAKIFIGPHKAQRITSGIQLVIYSPAVQKNNPELKEARKLKIKSLSYPEALGELTKKYFTIAVSGTHGKSTTTAMVSLIFIKAGLDPTVIVGTKLKEFKNSTRSTIRQAHGGEQRRTTGSGLRLRGHSGRSDSEESSDSMNSRRLILSNAEGSNCRVGKSRYLIIEADEWQASFLRYSPKIIVLINIEKEHLDYYKNLSNIFRAFRKFISYLPQNGVLVANRDDKNIKRILTKKPKFKVQNYSLKQIEASKLRKILKIPGEHNVSDALAALTVARILKIPDKIIFQALSEYKGSWRRFEIKKLKIGNKNITVLSDYAHHPTEIKATLQAARKKFQNQKIWCVFQPHQYQRTFYLFKDFVKVLKQAPIDKLIITDIYDVAGRETDSITKRVSSKKMVEKIQTSRFAPCNSAESGIKQTSRFAINEKNRVAYIPTIKQVFSYLKRNLSGGEIVIIMGAGDIYNLAGYIEQSSL